MSTATLNVDGKTFTIQTVLPVPPSEDFLNQLIQFTNEEKLILVGLDIPIGLPIAYASKLGTSHFREFIGLLSTPEWKTFFSPAENASQISLTRPFYPLRPGEARFTHLLQGLGLQSRRDLFRKCELPTSNRKAASPLFWTMGAQQVGKAALHAWKQLLIPALAAPVPIHLWPFDGWLRSFSTKMGIVFAESYPTEYRAHFTENYHLTGGKRKTEFRRAFAEPLLNELERSSIFINPSLHGLIHSGFGNDPDDEDLFDSFIGLAGMLKALLSPSANPVTITDEIQLIEGWIFGQDLLV